jgi:hypothetical protein
MEMLIGGTWQAAASGRAEDVTSPFDGAVVGTVPVADGGDVGAALDRAEAGAASWRRTLAAGKRRPEGERHRQGRPPLGGGRDDRCQDRHPARPSLVRPW